MQKKLKALSEKVPSLTIALGFFAPIGFFYILTKAPVNSFSLELFLYIFLNSILAFISFTPLHEACHKNIQGNHKSLETLENTIGYLSGFVLGIPFPLFRVQHLAHHSFVNDSKKDPDYWVASSNPLQLVFRCLTILPAHYVHFCKNPSKRGKKLILNTIGINLLLLLSASLIIYLSGLPRLIFLWLLPSVLGLGFLGFSFDWLPHHPHQEKSRYLNARLFQSRYLDVVLLMQNLHLIHHLYPRIPFHQYRRAYELLLPELIENNCKIV